MRALPVVLAVSLLASAGPAAGASHPPEPAAAARQVLDLSAAIAAADRNRGRRARAGARLAAGDPEGALVACAPVLASLVDGSRCRLLSAEALLALDRPGEAAKSLAPTRGRLGILEPWGRLLQGEALAAAGDPAAALADLDEATRADPDGPLARRAAPAPVHALARAGKVADAKAAADALGDRVPVRVRLILADALAAAGDPAAPAAYRELWRDHPGTPEADRARVRLDELAKQGATIPPATAAHRLFRASRLLDRGHPELAAKELEELARQRGATAAQKSRATLLSARAAVGRGERDLAEQLLAPLLAGPSADAVVPEALEVAARLAMRRGETDLAVARLDRIAREFSSHRLATEAKYLAAFFLYDAGRFAEAEARFRAFATAHPKAGRADEAAWYAAWTQYLDGRYAEAEKSFAALLAAFPRSALAPQVRYWRGRALERRGDAAGARAVFRDLAGSPEGWYALLAESRLPPAASGDATGPGAAVFAAGAGPERSPAPPVAAEVPLRTAVAKARLARAVALYDAGLPDLAGEELDAAVRGEKRAAVLEAVARIALEAGDAYRAHRLGTRLPGSSGQRLAYPRAYSADVEWAASGLGVDPHLVWAIMRRESAFRPTVRSHAAAVGLLQLLPKTATRICETAGLDSRHAGRLGEPAVNVALGTWYLSKLLERFDGNPALAAAAYNAGPENVARWLRDRKGLALDEFVESIPFRETRHYVKRVVGDLAAYRRQGGAPPPALAEALPALRPGVSF